MDAASLIKTFDGPTKFAAALTAATGKEFTVPVVCNWVHRGVPWRWRGVIDKLIAHQPKRRRKAA